MVIYKTTNLINGKIYIGQDKKNNPKYLGSGDLIKKAIKKYGKENFIKEIIKACFTQDELDKFEKYFITEFDSRNNDIGYNIAVGGIDGTTLNRKLSEDVRNNMSIVRIGTKLSDETKQKISKAHVGKKLSEETKQKIKESGIGCKNHFYGKNHSDETLLKTRKPIIQLDLNNNFIKEWCGINEAAKSLGLRQSGISAVLVGRYKMTGGYIFKYKNA